jgi:hypothetical protein
VKVAPTDSLSSQFDLRKDFTQPWSTLSLALNVRVDSLESGNANASLSLGTLDFVAYALAMELHGDGLHLVERFTGQTVDHLSKVSLAVATWVHVQLSATRDAGGAPKIALMLDGNDALGGVFTGGAAVVAAPTLRIGIVKATGPSSPRVAHFDDAVIDLH